MIVVVKIATQGFEASFHTIAARRIYGDEVEFIFCKTFKEVFLKLESGAADKAVVAIENSLYGSINEVYDLLLKYNFWITAEAYEQISLHLLGLPGSKLDQISDIYSQAPALGEADVFLGTRLAKAERHDHADTALAAKEVAAWNDPTKAAIAGAAAAQLYGLEILEANIETHPENYTRFIALSGSEAMPPKADKTSLVFQTADTPGSLYQALGVFAKAGINLTKLESRPIIGQAWRYMYYVDVDADLAPDSNASLLNRLATRATHIRILGRYKAGELTKA